MRVVFPDPLAPTTATTAGTGTPFKVESLVDFLRTNPARPAKS